MQRVAGLLEFLGKGAAQALGGLAEVGTQTVALLRQTAMQVREHGAVLLFQALLHARGQLLQLAAKGGHAPCEPARGEEQQNAENDEEFQHGPKYSPSRRRRSAR